jgi:hypothetical protein
MQASNANTVPRIENDIRWTCHPQCPGRSSNDAGLGDQCRATGTNDALIW